MSAGLCIYSFRDEQFARISLIGRPGSGKGYLCESLLRSGHWSAGQGAGEAGQRWLAPVKLLAHPVVSILLFAAVSTRVPFDLRAFRHAVRVVRKFDALKRERGPGLVVVDEGAVHAVFNVFFWSSPTTVSRFFTRQLLRALQRPCAAFVCLDIGKEAALENTRRRNHPKSWFNDHMSNEVAERFMRDTSYDEIVQTLAEVAPAKVHAFSSVEDARDFILNWRSSDANEPQSIRLIEPVETRRPPPDTAQPLRNGHSA